jgi:hypothetical protein
MFLGRRFRNLVSKIDSASRLSRAAPSLALCYSSAAHAVIGLTLTLEIPRLSLLAEESSSRPRLTSYTSQPPINNNDEQFCFPALLNSWISLPQFVLLFSAVPRGRSARWRAVRPHNLLTGKFPSQRQHPLHSSLSSTSSRPSPSRLPPHRHSYDAISKFLFYRAPRCASHRLAHKPFAKGALGVSRSLQTQPPLIV